MTREDIETIHESLQRCNRNPQFIDMFYEHFFSTGPEVQNQFAHTDMQRQKRMLEASLHTCILAAEGVPYAVASIKHLGTMHRDRSVAPHLYGIWLDSLVDTVKACDDAFDAHIEMAWRTVMLSSIRQMLNTYPSEE